MNNSKRVFSWHGKTYYYLGKDESRTNYYLENAHFDCEWYWGIGYIESFTNNNRPELSKDIVTHEHFDSKILNGKSNGFDNFKQVFPVNPFSDNEIWKICELMKSAYTARHYSDMLHIGGAHYTSNPAKETIQNETEYNRINKSVIPAIMTELYKILKGDTVNEH